MRREKREESVAGEERGCGHAKDREVESGDGRREKMGEGGGEDDMRRRGSSSCGAGMKTPWKREMEKRKRGRKSHWLG
ncbi:hypothetical protein U1Q18_005615 [Sarracenia purpurea var. burkii]